MYTKFPTKSERYKIVSVDALTAAPQTGSTLHLKANPCASRIFQVVVQENALFVRIF